MKCLQCFYDFLLRSVIGITGGAVRGEVAFSIINQIVHSHVHQEMLWFGFVRRDWQ